MVMKIPERDFEFFLKLSLPASFGAKEVELPGALLQFLRVCNVILGSLLSTKFRRGEFAGSNFYNRE